MKIPAIDKETVKSFGVVLIDNSNDDLEDQLSSGDVLIKVDESLLIVKERQEISETDQVSRFISAQTENTLAPIQNNTDLYERAPIYVAKRQENIDVIVVGAGSNDDNVFNETGFLNSFVPLEEYETIQPLILDKTQCQTQELGYAYPCEQLVKSAEDFSVSTEERRDDLRKESKRNEQLNRVLIEYFVNETSKVIADFEDSTQSQQPELSSLGVDTNIPQTLEGFDYIKHRQEFLNRSWTEINAEVTDKNKTLQAEWGALDL